jgi:phosphate:Na+ symporter
MDALTMWHFLGGLAVFIFALSQFEDALNHLAGRPFKKFLEKQTASKIKAIGGGLIITALLQSSSIVNLTVLSFVGAGILSVKQAFHVVMGANLGSTLSSWFIALLGFKLNLEYITYPILGLSLLGFLIPRNRIAKKILSLTFGFSLMFIGIEWMKSSAAIAVNYFDFNTIKQLSPYLFIPIGFILTALVQSSSAMMAIVLTALYAGSFEFMHAAGLIIGSELGTTIKVIISGYTGKTDKKRLAYGNFYFNSYTLLISSVLLYPLTHWITTRLQVSDPLMALVLFQSGINLLAIISFYPFSNRFVDWLQLSIKTNDNEVVTKYLHKVNPEESDGAMSMLQKELNYFLNETIILHRKTFDLETEERQLSLFDSIRGTNKATYEEHYDRLKLLHGELMKFCIEATSHTDDQDYASRLIDAIDIAKNILRAAKNIKDIRHNIIELKTSSNDYLYREYQLLQDNEDLFTASIEKNFKTDPAGSTKEEETNKSRYDHMVQRALNLLHQGHISEIEVSSLLNIYREVYSAHKALLNAADEFKPA